MNPVLRSFGDQLARYLSRRRHIHGLIPSTPTGLLLRTLVPGDVLLVEGDTRVSTAIKYLTQSTWSHAALYVGRGRVPGQPEHCFVEADIRAGVRSIGATEFEGLPTRICRPVGLTDEDRDALVAFTVERIGYQYDLRNVIDLARYLLPTPPVPVHFRRRMIALGSGDPTRAICSTLIAQAFQAIGYPVLPIVEYRAAPTDTCPRCVDEILHIRDHSLYTPRDFDISPYFRIIKPQVEAGFDYRDLAWHPLDPSETSETSGQSA